MREREGASSVVFACKGQQWACEKWELSWVNVPLSLLM